MPNHINRLQLYDQKFMAEDKITDWNKEFPQNPDFSTMGWSLSGFEPALKFMFNGYGVHANLTKMLPQNFPAWLVCDMDKAQARYVEQVVSSSYQFLNAELTDAKEGLEKLSSYMIRKPQNSFFGLRDVLHFSKDLSFWYFIDTFSLGNLTSRSIGDKLSKAKDIPDKLMSDKGIQYKHLYDLMDHNDEDNEKPDCFSGRPLKTAVDKALEVYKFAKELRDASF